jgi:putative PIN family toxin of toxin-antitoxin system
MRVILDTNVLLGALISARGAAQTIYLAWRASRFALVTSTVQLDELRRVSQYPKIKAIVPAHRIGTMVNNLLNAVVLDSLSAMPEGSQLNDPNDEFLLSMALASQADFLITADRKAGLLQLRHIGRTRVLTPGEFCVQVLGQGKK